MHWYIHNHTVSSIYPLLGKHFTVYVYESQRLTYTASISLIILSTTET